MKLCKDCKFGKATIRSDGEGSSSMATCMHKKSITEIDFYNGEHTYSSCHTMRSASQCGVDAILFEQRPIRSIMSWKE